MARSYRRTPIAGNTGADSDKVSKRRAGRALRSSVRRALAAGDHEVLPHAREICSMWSFPKDGKSWFGGLPPAQLAVVLRK